MGADVVVAWVLFGLAVGAMTARRMSTRERDRRDATMRRIGWGYGYGAGWVDAARGRYEPGAPADGKTRDRRRPIEPIPRRR
jgi:hypothetical protein